MSYKINWLGRVIFRNKDAAHRYWLHGFHSGKKRGYELRMEHEKQERAARKAIKQGASA